MFGTLVFPVLAAALAAPALPWVIGRNFGPKRGVWLGVIEVILMVGMVAFFYNALVDANTLCGAPTRFEGNTVIDNDYACRALFVAVPLFLFSKVWLLVTILSVSVYFLVYRKRMNESV